jgi:hypothetical protein
MTTGTSPLSPQCAPYRLSEIGPRFPSHMQVIAHLSMAPDRRLSRQLEQQLLGHFFVVQTRLARQER